MAHAFQASFEGDRNQFVAKIVEESPMSHIFDVKRLENERQVDVLKHKNDKLLAKK
jgi:hypothetical protein